MSLVFQYGSNCDAGRLNARERLDVDARDCGRAETVDEFDIAFDVWSQTNGCGASDLVAVPGSDRRVWGVLYEIPADLIRGQRTDGRKTLSQIEGKRYEERPIRVRTAEGEEVGIATTFVVRAEDRRAGLWTSFDYVQHIVRGLRAHEVPEGYVERVIDVAIHTNHQATADVADQTRLIDQLRVIAKPDFRTYYDIESYLFHAVSPRFAAEHKLSAFDFFCIVIWKANRAKTRVAKRLLAHSVYPDLDAAVQDLTAKIAAAQSTKNKLQVLMVDWGFLLPMASAILAVLYPDDFTVYDIRVCDMLGDCHSVANKVKFESIWAGYAKYTAAVREKSPTEFSLRDKDRWLWGGSLYNELQEDIATKFSRTRKISAEKSV